MQYVVRYDKGWQDPNHQGMFWCGIAASVVLILGGIIGNFLVLIVFGVILLIASLGLMVSLILGY